MLENVTIHQLELFCAVMETGGFSRAAEKLLIGQPAISQQVKRLQETLGVELFERDGRGVRPTPPARTLYRAAQDLFAARTTLARVVDDLKSGVRGEIRAGAGTTIGDYLLPQMLGAWQAHYPSVELEARIANTRQVGEWLSGGQIDVGFFGEEVQSPDLEVRQWLEDEVVVVVPADSPLAHGSHSPEALLPHRFIFREAGSATRGAVERCLRQVGVAPSASLSLGSNEALKHAVAAGLGVAMLSRFALDVELRAGELAICQIEGMECRRWLYLGTRRNSPPTKAAEAFIQFAYGWARAR